jgi:general secretion pathway protein I
VHARRSVNLRAECAGRPVNARAGRAVNACTERARAFTLVEVLVALAIISIALLAALRAAGQGANNAAALRAHLLAGWVAENRLAEHRARIDWLPLGIQRGTAREGGRDFTWREEVIATPNPNFRRVDIFVYADDPGSGGAGDNAVGGAAARLSGFIVHPQ